jgi:uncharacterized protein
MSSGYVSQEVNPGMRSSLLDLICCPICRQGLGLRSEEISLGEIWTGDLICPECLRVYPIIKGIPHLFVDDGLWRSKAQEAQGWVELYKEKGQYEVPSDGADLQLPYYPEEPWISFAASFDIALEELRLTGKEVILDVGAGRGWAAKHFALRGCHSTAVDILADENIGLGRAWALMENAKTYFAPMIADGERLPFLPGSVDIIFCSAALHHSSNLELLLHSFHRVLKSGGRLCAINEPSISLLETEEGVLERDADEELRHGINENRPNFLEYYTALQQAGFGNIRCWNLANHAMPLAELWNWGKAVGAVRPDIAWVHRWRDLDPWVRFLRLQLHTLRVRPALKALLVPGDDRESLIRLITLFTTGAISLLAEKP